MNAVGMSPMRLLDVLTAELRLMVERYCLDNGRQGTQRPQVFEQLYPPKDAETADAPFVYAYLSEHTDSDQAANTQVRIIVGTYSMDLDGWRDAFNVAMHIRQELLNRRMFEKYLLLLPLRMQALDQLTEQQRSYPFHFVQFFTTWQTALVLPPPMP